MVYLYSNGKQCAAIRYRPGHFAIKGRAFTSVRHLVTLADLWEALRPFLGKTVLCVRCVIPPSRRAKAWYHATAPGATQQILVTCLLEPSQIPFLPQDIGAPHHQCPVCRTGFLGPKPQKHRAPVAPYLLNLLR